MSNLFSKPVFHISLLVILLLVLFLFTKIPIPDANFVYQNFTEKLATGHLDLSIPGFHGADFLAVPIFLIFKTHLTVIYLDLLLALLCLPAFYFLGKEIFQSKKHGVFLAYAYALMPLDYLNGFRGDHHIAFIFFFALGLYLILKKSWWSAVVIGFSYIIKPYAIFAAPFFWAIIIPFNQIKKRNNNNQVRADKFSSDNCLSPADAGRVLSRENLSALTNFKILYLYLKQYKFFFASLIIPIIYLIIQLSQKSQILIGDHPEFTPQTLFSFKNFIFNLSYALQNVFSIHSFSPFSHVYLTDMTHITPIIMFLALIAIFLMGSRFIGTKDPIDKRLRVAITLTAILGLIIPSAFQYLDLWRLIVFYIMIIILAIPMFEEYKYFLPITVGLSGFQFFYAYLTHQTTLWPSGNKMIFLVWGVIFLISFIYSATEIRNTKFKIISNFQDTISK